MSTPHGRGEAWSSRSADDGGCAWRCRREAAGWSPVRPTRRGPGTREVSPEQTRRRHCRRWHPSLCRRCPVVGGAWFWHADRLGGPRVTRRPARQDTLACQRGPRGPDLGRQPQRATPPDRGAASTRMRWRGRLVRTRVPPRHRLREHGPSGSMRGAPGHRCPYRGGSILHCRG